MDYDVAVIGGGPGGYVAAIRAAQLGAKTILIEKSELGGTCLNRGCIPTKAILASAAKYLDLKKCEEFGLKASDIGFDFAKVMERKNKVVQQLVSGIVTLVKSNNIESIQGSAKLQNENTIEVKNAEGTTTVKAKKIILATGSVPFMPPIQGIDLQGVVNSDQLLEIQTIPESIVIVGGGVIGLEFASILQSFGSRVTVVEMLPNILDFMDKDIINRLGVPLRKQGVKFMTSTQVKKFTQNSNGITVLVENNKGEEELIAQMVLVCTGRRPVVEDLGLETVGIDFDNKGVAVNEKMQTNIKNIYAIGDLIGKSMLAHSASAAGVVAAENACGQVAAMDFDNIPSCVFTMPEIASVGITEQQATKEAIEVVVNKFNFAANGKALSLGETDGFVKIIAEKDSHKILGVHILGPHASDLIMEGAVAICNGLTAEQIAHTVHPHPTLSETLLECVHGIFGSPIHQVKMNRK